MNVHDQISARLRDDRGIVAGSDVLLFGFAAIVLTAIVVINAWLVVDTALAVSAAAREGARAFVESDDLTSAENASAAAVGQVLAEYGHTNPSGAQPAQIMIDGGQFRRCAVVTVEASVDVDLVNVPFFGALGSHTISASHSERIDPFRSGAFDFGNANDLAAACA